MESLTVGAIVLAVIGIAGRFLVAWWKKRPVASSITHNLPHDRNLNFYGRKDYLEKIRRSFVKDRKEPHSFRQAVHGLGGVGKTGLALEYAYRNQRKYNLVWWVRSKTNDSMDDDYRKLAQKLNLPVEKDTSADGVNLEVRGHLDRNGKWLLILDNVETPGQLEGDLPHNPKGDVLITSKHDGWPKTDNPIKLEVFKPEEGERFLLDRTEDEDADSAKLLAERLGNLPLALEQAGGYIEQNGITLSEYLAMFEESRETLLKSGKPVAYGDTVYTTWSLSMEKIKKDCLASAQLLNLLAFLAPDDIPLYMIINGAELLPEPLRDKAVDKAGLLNILEPLRSYSLVELKGDAFSLHRLVQDVTRDGMEEEEKSLFADSAVEIVNKAFPFKEDNVETWEESGRLLPHAIVACSH